MLHSYTVSSPCHVSAGEALRDAFGRRSYVPIYVRHFSPVEQWYNSIKWKHYSFGDPISLFLQFTVNIFLAIDFFFDLVKLRR